MKTFCYNRCVSKKCSIKGKIMFKKLFLDFKHQATLFVQGISAIFNRPDNHYENHYVYLYNWCEKQDSTSRKI